MGLRGARMRVRQRPRQTLWNGVTKYWQTEEDRLPAEGVAGGEGVYHQQIK